MSERVDNLIDKVVDLLDGEANEDVCHVCAAVAALAIADHYPLAQRDEALDNLIGFMEQALERVKVIENKQ